MKKLTLLLFALLLATVGAWAQSVDLQASTSTDAPEHMYLLANGRNALLNKDLTKFTDINKTALPGRFAFYRQSDGTYKIRRFDGGGYGWLMYNSSTSSLMFEQTEERATKWEITPTSISGTSKGYQIKVSGGTEYLNLGENADKAGVSTSDAQTDAGSGWKLIVFPTSGKKYYFQDYLNVYVNLENTGSFNGNTEMATVTNESKTVVVTVNENGNWTVATEAGNYLGRNNAATKVGIVYSNVVWYPVLFEHNGEIYYMLSQSTGVTYGDDTKQFLGNNSHENATVLWANAPGKEGLKLRLVDGGLAYREITINVKNSDDPGIQYIHKAYVPEGKVQLQDYMPEFSFVSYVPTEVDVDADHTTFELNYTVDKEGEEKVPFFTSYAELTQEDKQGNWVSFFTLNGRMHVYDPEAELKGAEGGRTKRNSTIDRATFTRLNDNFFWGFVRESRFKPTYIVNKAAKEANGTYDKCLYLTFSTNDSPVLMGQKDAIGVSTAWITREWIIEKSKNPAIPEGETHYGLRANRVDLYINNYDNKGYMSSCNEGPDVNKGSDLKFTPELETYNIMKERALNAPCNAVQSLNAKARKAIKENNNNTVAGYKEVIADINNGDSETGFIQFNDGKYYVLRNYTPAGENEKVYALGSDNGRTVKGFEVPAEYVGSSDEVMKVSNVNTIWKITTNPNGPEPAEGTYFNTSKTIARFVEHVNSGNKLSSDGTDALSSVLLIPGTVFNYYFVNLGAGQHFIKSVQFTATGQQAKSMPISVKVDNLPIGAVQTNDDGTAIVERRAYNTEHYKNSRDTWYGIEVNSIEVEIGEAGYATIYLPFGVTLPEGSGLEAYAVAAAGDGVATLTGVTAIPANQGAILKGEAGTYTLKIDDNVTAWDKGYNKLKGTCMATYELEDAYVLSMQNNVVGLYKAEMNQVGGMAWLNNANKAYLPVSDVNDTQSGESRFLSFNFDTVTGLDVIKGAESASSESVVYDLSGRRVRTAQKGLYIVNGKKIVK